MPPLDPKAVALVDDAAQPTGRRSSRSVTADPKLLNARGPEGSTPFMYAVLYTDAPTLERLIKLGADPNKRNDAGATALMWAALDLEKTRVLLAHGADVNAQSEDARTPLMIAAGRPGGAPIVKLLLAHGANPNPTSNPERGIVAAAGSFAGRRCGEHAGAPRQGRRAQRGRRTAIANAAGADCTKCVDLLVARKLDAMQYTIALQQVAFWTIPI